MFHILATPPTTAKVIKKKNLFPFHCNKKLEKFFLRFLFITSTARAGVYTEER